MLDLKAGKTLQADFILVEQGKVIMSERAEITWKSEVVQLVEVSLSSAVQGMLEMPITMMVASILLISSSSIF